jgi:hypothetical protein
LLAVVLLTAAGCLRPQPIQYGNAFAVNNWVLAKAAREFKGTLRPLSKGRFANPGQVRAAYDRMAEVLRQAKTEAGSVDETKGKLSRGDAHLPRPLRFSGPGKRLHAAYLAFLEGQDKLLKNQLLQVVQIVENGTSVRPEDQELPPSQWAKIQPLLEEVAAEEEKTMKPLTEAQKHFARYYDANLVPMPTSGRQSSGG